MEMACGCMFLLGYSLYNFFMAVLNWTQPFSKVKTYCNICPDLLKWQYTII